MRFFSLFPGYLVLLVPVIICSSCKKEYSYEGGPISGIATGTAVYTLEGAGGNCSGAVVNGKYVTGGVLLPANNVQLRVSVTKTGTYILSTNLVNGIQFATSGNFTTTGLQTITLTGNGTPSSTGTSTFSPPVGPGCAFFITVTSAQALVAQYTLEGGPGACSSFKINGTYTAGFALAAPNTAEVMVNVTSIGSYSINTDTINAISFSQTGNFTTTGIQKVILQGVGTPLIPDILIFNASTGTSVCSFIMSVVTPGAPATYVLESDPDKTCNGFIVAGTFSSGTSLSTTDNITVKVTVTVKGSFTITTDKLNGMVFSYTGEFLTIGAQVVILEGRGTPASPGTFKFTPQIVGPHPIGGEVCTADITVL
ncbi:MAG: hypothetical protein ABI416_03460 [Ginsengibacter sp.]